jgi:hypothetical protein
VATPVNSRQGIANFWVKVINPSTALAGEQPAPRREIPRPGHEEDRQDDGQDV